MAKRMNSKRVGVLLSALYSTYILMNFIYPIFTLLEWPWTQCLMSPVMLSVWVLLPDRSRGEWNMGWVDTRSRKVQNSESGVWRRGLQLLIVKIPFLVFAAPVGDYRFEPGISQQVYIVEMPDAN